MNLWSAFLAALRALGTNWLRSMLTMLGIIIGVAAVITMIAIGGGARQRVEQQIKALQVQLAQAQEKAKLFEAVIDVLRKDYGVRIVKKPLGKSSRKTLSQG